MGGIKAVLRLWFRMGAVSKETLDSVKCERLAERLANEHTFLPSEHKAGRVKTIRQNHQFLGVNNTLARLQRARDRVAAGNLPNAFAMSAPYRYG